MNAVGKCVCLEWEVNVQVTFPEKFTWKHFQAASFCRIGVLKPYSENVINVTMVEGNRGSELEKKCESMDPEI